VKGVASTLSLFSSASTLICCALPALLVSIGAGATLAGLVSRFPQLIWLSERSAWIFSIAGVFMLLGGYAQWRARFEPCPIDPVQAQACTRTRRISLIVYLISAGIFSFALIFTYVVPWMLF
jgi:hypothetical protein